MSFDPFKTLKPDPYKMSDTEDPHFLGADIKARSTEVRELSSWPNGLLAIRASDNGTTIDFAMFELTASDLEESVDTNRYQVIFHGRGYAGNLRECRHVFFGGRDDDSGYVYYVRPNLIAEAFKVLEEWFDFR